ncbi:MAG: fumarylacetoacetate hydrolase family protein [Gemmatimonadaceae bacterium]|nr:fumarylacetoacetate hydrolase family protein [Gemmatimonadaceae bacterium]
MRLIRWGAPGAERPGVLVDGVRRDCSALIADFTPQFFREDGPGRLRDAIAAGAALPEVPADARWAACIPRPGKVVCIGLNYRDHASEIGAKEPREPIIFLKASNCVVGPYDDVLIPRLSVKTDYEVELGIVIGRDVRYLASPADAPAHIAGWCIVHDVSEREFQVERGGQWTKGKSCDTFAPTGPWLATPDEVPDARALALTCDVNGERRQSGTTAQMIFDPFVVVHYLSQFMTLEAGDLVATGTPAGVGMAAKPPRFLSAGDVVELSVEGLGTQRQVLRPA